MLCKILKVYALSKSVNIRYMITGLSTFFDFNYKIGYKYLLKNLQSFLNGYFKIQINIW